MKKNKDDLFREISIINEQLYWEKDLQKANELVKKKNDLRQELNLLTKGAVID